MRPRLLLVVLAAAAVHGAVPAGTPFRDLRVAGGKPQVKPDEHGFVVANRGPVRARVAAPEDAFLCRLKPGANPDVVELAVGRVMSARCDTLYSPMRDLALEFVGGDLHLAWRDEGWHVAATGPLRVAVYHDFLKTERDLKYYRPLNRRAAPRPPAGWCSWYVYWTGITEEGMIRNTAWLKDNLAKFGAHIVQIDDGWQGVGQGLGRNRDWTITCEKKFPHGMKWLADQIRAAGFEPGIWLIPFGQSSEAVDQANPGVFLRDANGRSVGILDKAWAWEGIPEAERMVNWCGAYLVDPTSARSQAYLVDLFRTVCEQWGYDYVKIDGQGGMPGLYSQYQQQLADPAQTGDLAYRQGLRAVKQTMGEHRFLLNCGGAFDSAGICEGIRTGGDVGPSWSGMQAAIDATFRHLFKNNLAFYTDPDVVCVRPEGDAGSTLTLDQARLWATLYGITGQMTLASDDMPKLPAERVEMLRRIMPVGDVRPMELYPLSGRPRIFDVRVNKPGVGQWDVVAVFNWKATGGDQVTIQPVDLGLPPGRYVYYDVWARRLLGATTDGLPLSLAPTSCRVVSLRPYIGRPQLVGTSRHLLQGADDLLGLKEEGLHVFTGRSQVVAGDPYELRFTLPPDWRCLAPGAKSEGGLAVLTLRSPKSADMAWRCQFVQFVRPPSAGPMVGDIKVQTAGRATKLTWPGSPALAWRVYRDGALIGQVAEPSFLDYRRRRGPVEYQVSALDWTRESMRASAPVYTPPPLPREKAKDAWLDELNPLSAAQEWGQLRRRTSAEGNPIRIAGKEYARGLGTHAHSEVIYQLHNAYSRFEAEVGVDDEKGGLGTVDFQVLADGEKVYDSGVLKGNDPAKHVSVPLEGVDELTLIVTDGGDGINCDHADWAEARLTGNP
ncbi:MAG: NPCBM/NEW2 domain-containing protein [Armatimonadetes bacterium]|nr:NPCBM/NEW2 domain-containing protein [Armatimonadota bacterium]